MFWLLLPFIMYGVTNSHSSVLKLFDISYVEQELRDVSSRISRCEQQSHDRENISSVISVNPNIRCFIKNTLFDFP
jgi:hypothetical protein